jgi:hypothetical protein
VISKGFQWQTISSSLYVQGLSSVASTGLVTLSPAVYIDWEETYFVQSVTATLFKICTVIAPSILNRSGQFF